MYRLSTHCCGQMVPLPRAKIGRPFCSPFVCSFVCFCPCSRASKCFADSRVCWVPHLEAYAKCVVPRCGCTEFAAPCTCSLEHDHGCRYWFEYIIYISYILSTDISH